MIRKFLPILTLLFCSLSSQGQEFTHGCYGTVQDQETGKVLEGAQLKLKVEGKSLTSVVCDDEGKYNLALAPSTPFDLDISAPGYQPILLEGVQFEGEEPTYVEIHLKPTRKNPPDYHYIAWVPAPSEKDSIKSSPIERRNKRRKKSRKETKT